ncbi:uncharacterized protein ACNLHF_027498 isoform 1-T2 [Anomaloglossus baeobatrachus]|uniref:uncharacterized protein LOC142248802 n=1 Tax=Anomaloglossus baeobatrachus TaxID=238106 RepID=UPI003F4F861D
MIVRISVNGEEMERMATEDPHSFYTILNECPEDVHLGEEAITIALKNGKEKVTGRLVMCPIYINGQETTGQIIYVQTFQKIVIGWKQLHDLGLMQAKAQEGYVVDVPPVLIKEVKKFQDPGSFHQGYLRKELLDHARRVIASWERNGWIERCKSVCNSRISLDIKPNGKVKIKFHYWDLNETSEKDSPHPQEHRPKAIEGITLGKYYSVLHLFYAEWQIALDTYTKYKTAFTFLGKHYVWNRLPGKFQNKNTRVSDAVEKVLDKLPVSVRKRVTYYIDVLLISGETKEECSQFTDKLWHHLSDNCFEIRPAECQLCQPAVKFLGRKVTENGVTLDRDFLQKVKNMKEPKSASDLRSNLACLRDASQYTPGFGILSKSLNKLSKQDDTFIWDGKSKEALALLKKQVLQIRFLVPGLAENEACTVKIFVNDGAWMAEIQNSAKKPYRFDSGVFPLLKKKDNLVTQELKAMKEVWSKFQRVLKNREVEWEVESPEIARYVEDPDSIINEKHLKLDLLKEKGFKIKVVPAGDRKPIIPWPEIPDLSE